MDLSFYGSIFLWLTFLWIYLFMEVPFYEGPFYGLTILWIYHFMVFSFYGFIFLMTANNIKSIYVGASLPAPTILWFLSFYGIIFLWNYLFMELPFYNFSRTSLRDVLEKLFISWLLYILVYCLLGDWYTYTIKIGRYISIYIWIIIWNTTKEAYKKDLNQTKRHWQIYLTLSLFLSYTFYGFILFMVLSFYGFIFLWIYLFIHLSFYGFIFLWNYLFMVLSFYG